MLDPPSSRSTLTRDTQPILSPLPRKHGQVPKTLTYFQDGIQFKQKTCLSQWLYRTLPCPTGIFPAAEASLEGKSLLLFHFALKFSYKSGIGGGLPHVLLLAAKICFWPQTFESAKSQKPNTIFIETLTANQG